MHDAAPLQRTQVRATLTVAADDAARGRSFVTSARTTSPLCLLTPANHGRAAWVYQANHGGGFVGADDVALDVEVGDGAALFLSSQSSAKVYRATQARSTLDVHVGCRGVVVSWPDPLVCFADASLDQAQRFTLADESAAALVVDAWTAGRVAHRAHSAGERWAFARLRSSLAVDVGGVPALRDAVLLDRAHGDLDARMRGVDACATVVLAGAPFQEAARAVHERISATPVQKIAGAPLVVSSLRPFGAIVRVASSSIAMMHATLRDLFACVACDVLGDDPFSRRW